MKFNTSCCICHECFLRTTMSQKKIESLHDLTIFPGDWKCAKVTTLFKEGDRDDLNINLLSSNFGDLSYGQGL